MIGVIVSVVPVEDGGLRSFELQAKALDVKDKMYSWKYHVSPSVRPQPSIPPIGSLVEISFNRSGYVTTIRQLRAQTAGQ